MVKSDKKYSTEELKNYKALNKQIYLEQKAIYNSDEGGLIFWSSKFVQNKLFENLIQVGDLTAKEILDVGTGYGDFIEFLKKNKIIFKNYVGVDIVPEIVRKAKSLHPNNNFEIRDIQKKPFADNSFDYVTGSGIFSLNFKFYNEYVIDILKIMLRICRIAVAVNFSSEANCYLPNKYRYNNPDQLLEYIKSILVNEILIKENGTNEYFSIFIYK